MTTTLLKDKAKAALRAQFGGWADAKGYVEKWQDNLISGVSASQCEADLKGGAGQELTTKFCALHSSSALAVNTFAPFKYRPGDLVFQGHTGFKHIQFEKPVTTGLGGTPPHLDVWLQSDNRVFAVESKFLEYFDPKKSTYVGSYTRTALEQADDAWWGVLEDSKLTGSQYLDVAQLVKHAWAS